MYQVKTKRGYLLSEVVSALQKAARRGDARMTAYWAIEMFESRYGNYAWKRLIIITAEDCWGILTAEINALKAGYDLVNKTVKRGDPPKGRVFLSKAALLIGMAKKSRDADHLTNLVYDQMAGLTDDVVEAELAAVRGEAHDIPDEALCVHTQKGRAAGKTREQFIIDEHKALRPREPGLFDHLVTPAIVNAGRKAG
jgi:replication-associated recombination protein RarA